MKRIVAATLFGVAGASMLVASCATIGPTWSELSGARYTRAALDRRPLIIERVDGESTAVRVPIKIAPGRHEITVSSLRHGEFRGGILSQLTLDIEPCKRYYINAQYPDPVQPRYTPVVDYVEPIPGCRAGV